MHGLVDRSANHYEAVSYTWGKPVFTADLFCPGNSVLRITPHVNAMLRRLRKSHRPRNLWVDAICINQHDDQEKGQQVALMGEIYQQALKVILWLGDEDQDVKSVFAFIRALSVLEPPGLKVQEINTLLQETWGDTSWEALNIFLRRPWFGRRWVLQEAALARTAIVKCHDQKLSWVYLTSGLCKLGAAMEQLTSLSKEAVDALGTLQALQGGRRHLMELLWDFEHCRCFDKRDHIYALLGFADNIARGKRADHTEPGKQPADQRLMRIKVDYKATWETVYRRFATECIAQGYAFELLKHMFVFGTLRDQDDALPSWVPNWANKRMKIDTRDWPGEINITGLSMVARGKEILLKGPYCWATVSHVLPVPESPGAQPSHEEISQWIKSVPEPVFHQLAFQDSLDVQSLSKKPRPGLSLPEKSSSQVHLLAIRLKELLISSELSSTISPLDEMEMNDTPEQEIAILTSCFQHMPLGMSVIVLGSERLGIGPVSSERGDAVGCLSSTDNMVYGYILRPNHPLDGGERREKMQFTHWPSIVQKSLFWIDRTHDLADNDPLRTGRIVGRCFLSKDKSSFNSEWQSDVILEERFLIS
jgi:hypothetical protein